ncbi:thioredoxin family protein [Flavobacterium sp.]|uniref:thioredoxin family protein n=1 Tax=Flavobacterium sp. TaxID=239 RepID=UPI002B69C02E|nr:thioredoxin family protein [Flavobacterium sp.]HSD05808.1 thioredoxin family protein [Flavobacterium sp.]
MKASVKHTFLLLLLLLTATIFAQNKAINFIQNDYKLALEQSKSSKKIIFIMVHANWCSHCNKMKTTVLKDPTVVTFFNANFINLMMDSETAEGKDFMNKLHIKSFPTYIFLDNNETHLYSTGGEFTTEDFLVEAKKAMNPNTQLPYLEKRFNEDVRNSENCLLYLNGLRKSIDSYKSDEVVAKYLATQSKDQVFSAINWKIIAFGVNDLDSKSFDLIVKNQNDFAKVSSPKRVEAKIVSVVNKSLTQNMNSLDSINYSKNRILAKNINLTKIDSLVFKNDLLMYEATKNWKSYQQTTLESVQKYAWNDYSTINAISKNYIEHITDKEALKTAITWAKRSVELNNTAENTLLLARLYNKINDKKAAIENARKAKAIITAMGWDTKEINQFYTDLGIK